MIIYKGPSKLNGKPIVAILTLTSENRKTGQMGQLWILPQRSAPVTAAQTGYDEAVCGDCPMRHSLGGACYVNVGRGPQAVWKSWRKGNYPDNTALKAFRFLRGIRIRLGAYGDPAALPFDVVRKLLALTRAEWTGYTHQWRVCDPRFKTVVMASCDSLADYVEAKAKGWRTFRVVADYAENTRNERVCANDSHGTQCRDCMACHGGKGADISIQVHGSMAGRWLNLQETEAAG